MSHHGPKAPAQGRRTALKAAGAAAAVAGFPAIVRAQAQPIKIGVPTILSGRVAQLGISSRNAAQLEADAFNAAGGLNGRKIELVVRDSQGKPELAAKVTRDMINGDKVDFVLDCEASSGAFAVHEVARDLGTLTVHVCSETSSLTADPKLQIKNAFRVARQAAHDAISAGSYAGQIAKERGLTNWMTIGPDYAYGRDTTDLFMKYLTHFNGGVKLTGQ
ncbi:MAG: ABC transporter substrate-binding protein, partial [Gammaproteobacteria bacterium]